MELLRFRFSFRRRLKTALYPAGLAAVLAVIHVFAVRLGSWVSVALVATIALLLMRSAQWLWGGRLPIQIDEQGVVRGYGPRVAWRGAEVHLRARFAGKGGMRVDEVVVFTPKDVRGQRIGVSFDVSLLEFDKALEAILTKVPDARIKVWAPGGKPLVGEPREQLLAPYRNDIAQALAQAGRGTLAPPPGAPRPS